MTNDKCNMCGKCCKYLLMTFSAPLEHNSIIMHSWRGCIWYPEYNVMAIPARCKYLGDDDKCKIYNERPDVCTSFEKYAGLPVLFALDCPYGKKYKKD